MTRVGRAVTGKGSASAKRLLAAVFTLALAAGAWVGCNAIAGITDGQLGSDSGSDAPPGDGSLRDSPLGDVHPGDGPGGDAADAAVAHDGPDYSPPTGTLVNAPDAAPAPDPHFSPALTVLPGPGDASTLVVAFLDSDNPILQNHDDSWAVSVNSGASFADMGTFPDNGVSDYGDPGIASNPANGSVYIAVSGGAFGSFNFNQVAFLVSTNAGSSFATAVNAADPTIPSSDFTDVPAVAVDLSSGQGQGLGDVYTAYVHGGATMDLRVSKYSGGTFANTTVVTRTPPDALEIPRIIVAPNRYVQVVYYSQTSMQPSVNLSTSRNQGQSYDPETKVAPLHVPFVSGDVYGELGINGTGPDGGSTPVAMFASPQIAANPVSGNLYVVFADSTQGADKANVYFTHSEDGGKTWSTPVQVNDDQTTHDQFMPAIAVSPDGTRLAVDFYDRRDDPNNVLAYRYGATADIAGATVTFGPNFKVSSASFPILLPYAPNSNKFSLQAAMGADGTYFYDVYSDTLDGNIDIRLSRYGLRY